MNGTPEPLWYYAENGRQHGPLPNDEFMRLVGRGAVTAETLVWRGGMSAWKPYGELVGAASAGAAEAPCHYCGKVLPSGDLIDFNGTRVCAACKPVFVQQFKENAEVAPPLSLRYAGFWIRAAAYMLDVILVSIIIQAILVPLGALFAPREPSSAVLLSAVGMNLLVQLGVSLVYSTLPLVKWGATPGKMACGLKVIRSDGSKISWGRAIGRFFSEQLSAMLLWIGYIMAAIDKTEHKALHDIICDTRVIHKGG
jgi:uncharacterized RDD family membrane protein YckC